MRVSGEARIEVLSHRFFESAFDDDVATFIQNPEDASVPFDCSRSFVRDFQRLQINKLALKFFRHLLASKKRKSPSRSSFENHGGQVQRETVLARYFAFKASTRSIRLYNWHLIFS